MACSLISFVLAELLIFAIAKSDPGTCYAGSYKVEVPPFDACFGHRICEPGHYCLDGVKRVCPAGRYGVDAGLSQPSCSGPCARGYYCPPASTSATEISCGNSTVFCPLGSSEPRNVKVGYYTVTGVNDENNDNFIVLYNGSSGTVPASSERKCEPGSYCVDGIRHLCPAGRFGATYGLSHENCTADCTIGGYYCPEGSVSNTDLYCGDASRYCPTNHFGGNKRPIPVQLGYYSGTDNGDVFNVSDVHIRSLEIQVTRGYFAVKGLRYICPPGHYGAEDGQYNPECSGLCDVPGYYCPAGSTSKKMRKCGGSNVYCPPNTNKPLLVHTGFYTSDPALEVCPPGRWRNWTHLSTDPSLAIFDGEGLSHVATRYTTPPCELCPLGTYKSITGDGFELCISCMISVGQGDVHRHYSKSLPDRISCECTTSEELDVDEQVMWVYNITTSMCDKLPIELLPYLNDEAWALNTSLTRFEEYECEPGYYCVDGLRYACSPGYFGMYARETSLPIAEIMDESWIMGRCSGPCQPGYYCPFASASATNFPCGSADVFCPLASSVPISVSEGYYTNEDAPTHLRVYQTICPVAHYCQAGIKYPCPAGTYSDIQGLSSSICVGLCEAGYYCTIGSPSPTQYECGDSSVFCPRGSHSPIAVLNGFYTTHTGTNAGARDVLWDTANATNSAQIVCEPGYYCVEGIKYPCPPGTFGWRSGLNSSTCSGLCAPGYYCPSYLPPQPGTSSHIEWPGTPQLAAAVYPCGGSKFFCPWGTWFPRKVGGGNYTTGGSKGNLTRTGEEICPPGSYCIGGIVQPCPKGKFGNVAGLSSVVCSGWCPSSHQCPIGTAYPEPCQSRHYAVGAAWACAPCPDAFENDVALPCSDSRYCCFQDSE